MQTHRSCFLKLSFHTILFLAIAPFLFIGCAKNSDSETAGSLGSNGDFSVSIPPVIKSHRADNLTAQLTVDGGTPINLVVDLVNDTVSGTVEGLTPGQHTFVIKYFSNGTLIATASTTANIIAGETVAVIFPPESLVMTGGGSNWNEMNWNTGTWS